MRTTVEIDDDLIVALKSIAKQQHTTLGQVISEFTRRSLPATHSPEVRNGVRVFARRHGKAGRADLDVVNALRDEE